MNRAFLLSASALLVACGVGPTYRPEPVAPASAKVGTPAYADSLRPFFDSLAAAPGGITPTGPVARARVRLEPAPALADASWLRIIDDTVLVGLIRRAVAQNRDVALAKARITEYRANYDAVMGALLPSLTLNTSASKNQAVFGASPPIKFDALRATADVAWELDFWGSARKGRDAFAADLSSQEAAERAAELSLVSDVTSGYLRLLELDEERAISERTLESRRATLALARQRLDQGIVSELDVRQFEAQLAVPAARLAQVVRLRAQQEHALNLLLGEAPTPIRRGGSLVAATRAVAVPDSLPASLLDRRPDVVQAERIVAAATARVGIAQAARLPSVNIATFYGTQASAGNALFSSGTGVYTLQAGVSMPLFTGGRLKNEQAAAQARADQAKAAFERTALTALREAGDAVVAARTTRDEVSAAETQAAALTRALELATLRYQSGVSSYLEVLDAQRGLYDAELALAQARLAQLTATVQLYKALGGSWSR